jgi:NitT/TauT family transport system substrate-binding protein
MQVGAYAVTHTFAEENADAVKRFKAAIAETASYVDTHEDEFRTFLSESAKMPPEVAQKIVLPNWTGEVDAESVANTAKLMQRYGVVDKPVDAGKLLAEGS